MKSTTVLAALAGCVLLSGCGRTDSTPNTASPDSSNSRTAQAGSRQERKHQQLRVSLEYKRDYKVVERNGPDSTTSGQVDFTFAGSFEVLAEEGGPLDSPGTPEGESKWIGLFPTSAQGPTSGVATLASTLSTRDAVRNTVITTNANYTGNASAEGFRLERLAPAWPFTDGYDAEISVDIPMAGTATNGVPMTHAPVSEEGGAAVFRGSFQIFSVPGPAPTEGSAATLYKIKALHIPMAEVYASTAPKPVWIGAATQRRADGSWAFTYAGQNVWPMGDGGQCTDTLKVTIEPVARTLAVPEDQSE
jgi:hypothetical protein